jgi:hypothetical protein
MLNHNETGPFHARFQVGSSQIPEIGRSQAVKRVEKLGAPPRAQSRHCKMLVPGGLGGSDRIRLGKHALLVIRRRGVDRLFHTLY